MLEPKQECIFLMTEETVGMNFKKIFQLFQLQILQLKITL